MATIFDDDQALNLCKKISTPLSRALLINPFLNRLLIHQLAMRYYKKYGGHVVSFILSLPALRFGKKNSKVVENINNDNIDIPSIYIRFNKNGNEYFICFFEPQKRSGRDKIIASIYNKTNKEVEGQITYSGYIEERINKQRLNLKLFVDTINDKQKIFCSVESGRCINCNRELSDPNSLRVGYGRECAKELGIPYE